MILKRLLIPTTFLLVAAAFPIPILTSEAELSGVLRNLVLQNLPTPLYAKDKDWGRTKLVDLPRFRKGRFIIAKVAKNDGHWRKVRVDGLNPRDTFVLDVRDVERPSAGLMTFTLHVAMDVRWDVTQEHWENGIKLYGASIRARSRLQATMKCSVETKAEFKNLSPELALTVKVTEAKSAYDNLVVEHVAGLGGDAAKLIGKAGHEMIHQWKPSIERGLLEKANAAILKAAGHKEYRVSLDRLFKSKTPAKKP